MNWDKEAKSWAVAHGMGSLALGPVEATKRQTAVMHAAKWQRSQLRTNEAVERVARAMAGLEPDEEWPSNEALEGNLTGTRDDEYRDGMREQAKEAITALLGEEP